VSPPLLRALNLHPDWARTWFQVDPVASPSVWSVLEAFWASADKHDELPLIKVKCEEFLFLLDSPSTLLRDQDTLSLHLLDEGPTGTWARATTCAKDAFLLLRCCPRARSRVV
jgi:hypothetical protein